MVLPVHLRQETTKPMGDFVQQTITKSATRVLANPIADAASFDTLIEAVVTDNPFDCTAYTVGGDAMAAVAITKRSYGARLVWEDTEAKSAGITTDKYNTRTGFNAGVAVIMANAPLATAQTAVSRKGAESQRFTTKHTKRAARHGVYPDSAVYPESLSGSGLDALSRVGS